MFDKMSSKERLMACLSGKQYDRPPVLCPTSVATVDSMEKTGAYFPDVHLDSDKMAALAASSYELLGFDSVSPCFSVLQESAALGCTINWGTIDAMPTATSNPITCPEDFKLPDDFLDRKPVKTVLESIKLLKDRYKDKVAVIGKVMGPWTLAYNLHGVQEFLIKTLLEPDMVREFLNRFKEVSIRFAEAQFEAGADIITWADHATGDLISAAMYKDLLLPVHQQINRELKKSGPVILHTCGYTLDRMKYFTETGFEVFHFDSRNKPLDAVKAVDGKIMLTGCVNNAETLLHGTVDDVKSQVFNILDAGIRLISPECAVPCRVKNENLIAIPCAVEEYWTKR